MQLGVNVRITSFVGALLLALPVMGLEAGNANAGLFVSISVAPPPLPVYVQPPCPEPGYMWTPGYWAWDEDDGDYYWVPGSWVAAPEVGMLWTPGYWDWDDGAYIWHTGYWGPHVGYYGGVSYGFGYTGVGFVGGAWAGGVYTYNRAVTNVGVSISRANVYSKTVVVNANASNVSFHGGNGGSQAQPTAEEKAASREHHFDPTREQIQNHQAAGKDTDLKFAKNKGKPGVAATTKPGDFSSKNAVGAKSAGLRGDSGGKSWGAATLPTGQGGKSGWAPATADKPRNGQNAFKGAKPDAPGSFKTSTANTGNKPVANFSTANRAHNLASNPALVGPKPGLGGLKPALGAPKPAFVKPKPVMAAPKARVMAAPPRPRPQAPAGNGKNNWQLR
jgi:hypothetical protein